MEWNTCSFDTHKPFYPLLVVVRLLKVVFFFFRHSQSLSLQLTSWLKKLSSNFRKFLVPIDCKYLLSFSLLLYSTSYYRLPGLGYQIFVQLFNFLVYYFLLCDNFFVTLTRFSYGYVSDSHLVQIIFYLIFLKIKLLKSYFL